ncbi:hypothetical protein V8C34DRAFT_125130 [Trichoderma compactum]
MKPSGIGDQPQADEDAQSREGVIAGRFPESKVDAFAFLENEHCCRPSQPDYIRERALNVATLMSPDNPSAIDEILEVRNAGCQVVNFSSVLRTTCVEMCSHAISTQPIVFVCHDVGAAIAKQILLLALESETHRWIFFRTVALYWVEYPSASSEAEWEGLLFRLLSTGTVHLQDQTALLTVLPNALHRVEQEYSVISSYFRTTNFPDNRFDVALRVCISQKKRHVILQELGCLTICMRSRHGTFGLTTQLQTSCLRRSRVR